MLVSERYSVSMIFDFATRADRIELPESRGRNPLRSSVSLRVASYSRVV
jgi:hypothetical protein